MSNNIETELKYLLNRESFHSLYRYLRQKKYKCKLTRQVNYYFLAPDYPPSLGLFSTRIRFIQDARKGKWELTCKVSLGESVEGSVQNSYEYNAHISHENALNYISHGLPEQVQKELLGDLNEIHGIPMMDFHCIGHLRTSRFSFGVRDDLPPILLDVNSYLGVFDYEIEWELKETDKADTLLQGIFNELEIQPAARMMPKVRRFYDRLIELDNSFISV
jgi:uncharacterized protein YjbK